MFQASGESPTASCLIQDDIYRVQITCPHEIPSFEQIRTNREEQKENAHTQGDQEHVNGYDQQKIRLYCEGRIHR